MSRPPRNRQGSRPLFWFLLASALFWGLASRSIAAQQAEPTAKPISPSRTTDLQDASARPSAQDKQSAETKRQAGAFVIAPLPISSPALGSGVVPVFACIFPASDKTSPASLVGAVGLVTDNGSRAMALGGELYLKGNTYRTMAVYARGNLNYDLYGLGSGDSQARLSLKQTGQLVFGEFLRRRWWKFFLGPRFLWGSSLITVRPDNPGAVPLPPDLGLDTSLAALGFRINRDTRAPIVFIRPAEPFWISRRTSSPRAWEANTRSRATNLTSTSTGVGRRTRCLHPARSLALQGASLPSTETAFTAQIVNYADTPPAAISIVTCLVRSWNIGWPYPRGSALWVLAAWARSCLGAISRLGPRTFCRAAAVA